MAKPIETLSIQLKFKDAGSQAVIEKLRGSLKRLELGAAGVVPRIKGLRSEILAQGRASLNSVSNINAQRAALVALRDEARIGGKNFRQLTADIAALDAQLAKTQTAKSRGGMGARRATQTAGAIISGGIFGGPEGAIGGALGAFGGVEGAFAGAAIGAQVGMLRQQTSEFAEYAAGIQKLQIALREAAGSTAEYNKAIDVARRLTDELNVPQEVATRGMTRLTAAVKGAGGSVSDAALVFRNVTAAIKGTGGSAQDVDGAITAMVQVFSKGKVSAEELSGQLGERLAGAVTRFAMANKMSLTELQDALKKGEVGLNELMNFIVQLGVDFDGVAREIADSSQDAGARLQIAFNDMKISVGEALQPIGAEFQEAFAEFITDIAPALEELLPKIGSASLSVAKNLNVLGAAAAAAAGALGVLAVKAALIKAGGYAALFAGIAKSATAAGIAIKGMSLAALLNPWVLLAAGVAAATASLSNYYSGQLELNQLLDEGNASTSKLKEKIDEYELSIRKAEEKLKGLAGQKKATGRDAARLKKEVAELKGQLDRLQGTYTIRLDYESKGYKFGAEGQMTEFTSGGIVYGGKRGERFKALRKADGSPLDRTTFDDPKPDGSDAGASKIATAIANADKFGVQLGRTLEDLQSRIAGVGETATQAIARRYTDALRKANNTADDNIANIVRLEQQSGRSYQSIKDSIEEVRLASIRLAEETALDAIAKDFAQALKDAQQPLNELMSDFNSQIKERARIEELMSKGMSESLAKEIANIETIAAKEEEVLQKKIAQLRADALAEGLSEKAIEDLERKIELLEKQLKLTPGREEEAITKAKKLEDKEDSPGEKIAKGFEAAEKKLKELTNLGNIAVNSANMIGDAFGKAFTDIATGTATVKEAVGSMLQSIGQNFIKMAAEIIAQQMKMILLGALMKAVGVAAGGGGGGFESAPLGEGFSAGATPSTFDAVGAGIFTPKASGGPVNAGRPYMVGERGPELFVPGSNGGIMRNEEMRQLMGRSPAGAGGGAAAMNFTFETTNIGGTEYVSREQLEAAMATTRRQAANDGAKRGMSMTLDKMQNSPRTRSRIGIS